MLLHLLYHTKKSVNIEDIIDNIDNITIKWYILYGDYMQGINLNNPIKYLHASFRYFKENEHHTNRICPENVLLLVFDGVLRFREDGKDYEIFKGQYHVQKQNSLQQGIVKSDMPRYLYVHFYCDECSLENGALDFDGEFDVKRLMPLMERIDELSHNNATYIEQASVFYQILSELSLKKKKDGVATKVRDYIKNNYNKPVSLEDIKNEFSFSKNHIINLFKKEYGITPVDFLKKTRVNNAIRKMETTSDSFEEIAFSCGFNDYPYFYKAFRQEYGISPKAWRNKRRGNI